VVQHYAWGDTEFLPRLLGVEPDGRPWAELWLGTHPNGPTVLRDGSPLAGVTGDLPYLLKVLAVAEPLSLQTHPNPEQAQNGFALGLFPDPSPKSELLCAVTSFEAFCGFRPVPATLNLLDELKIDDLARALATDGPRATLGGLYGGEVAIAPIIDACESSERPEAEWVRQLARLYPGRPSVAVTLLLNYVLLAPGEALHIEAGNLHCYLHGAGIELMGPSDNVVRGGLTRKPVDVDELLRIVDLTSLEQPVLAESRRHDLPAAEVALVQLSAGDEHVATGHELAIDLNGGTWYLAPGETAVADAVTYVVTPI